MSSEVSVNPRGIQFATFQNSKVTLKAKNRLDLINPFIAAVNQQVKSYEQLSCECKRKALAKRDILIKNKLTLQKFFRDELVAIPFATLVKNKETITHVNDRIELQRLVSFLELL